MTERPSESRFAVLFFTDIVGSTDLKVRYGVPAYVAALRVHNDHFERNVRECHGIRILQNMGDGYFAEAGSVVEAVRFALLFQDAMRVGPWGEIRLTARLGIHAGEVGPLVAEGGSGIVGPAADLAASVMSLAVGGQILLTRFPFDEARHFLREHPTVAGRDTPTLRWLAHGPYLFKGRDEQIEIFEVGAEGLAPLTPPPDSVKVKRGIRPGEEETLGWRPAIGLEIPGRPGWRLTALLGKGGFGEVWIGKHAKLHQHRAFKFCFDDERLRALKREVTIVRLLRTALGDRDDIVRLHELKLDEPPFYLESDLAPHGNLLQWADKQGGLAAIPLAQRIGLVAHTATALAAAHSIGVLHKDIKPTNILIFDTPDGATRPRLVDFGIGTLADSAVLAQHGITPDGFTRPAMKHSTGTPTYSPPEYLAGKPYTVQGDIYALGVLLYQLIAAKPGDPIAPGWERDIADPLLREDIGACVDGDPARRLPSAADLADRLFHLDQRRAEIAERERLAREAAARAESEAAAAETRARRKHNRRTAAGVLLLGILCAAGGWIGFEYLASRSPGSVKISSEPPGAAVWREDQQVGVTPFTEKDRTRGQIVYLLKAEGFEDSKCIGIVSPGRLLSMQVSLRPKGNGPPPVESFPLEDQDNIYCWRLTEKEGFVEFKQADGRWTAAPRGMQLRAGDVVRTGESSRARLTFRDGTSMQLGERAEVSMSGAIDKPAINLERGGLYYFFHHGKSNQIQIRTPHGTAAVRG